jgi:hypothetical protein
MGDLAEAQSGNLDTDPTNNRLRQEAGPSLRVTVISPDYIETDLADPITGDQTPRSRAKEAGPLPAPQTKVPLM